MRPARGDPGARPLVAGRHDLGHGQLAPRAALLDHRTPDRLGWPGYGVWVPERRLHEQQDVVGQMRDRLTAELQVAQRARAVKRPEDDLVGPPADPHRRAVDAVVASAGGHDGLDQRPGSVLLSQQG